MENAGFGTAKRSPGGSEKRSGRDRARRSSVLVSIAISRAGANSKGDSVGQSDWASGRASP
jgi:hypothetical protein